jgi:ribulose-bisphosphate carboxylase large chain
VATTAFDPAQLLGVLFGNTSLHADVQCVDFDPPASLCEALQGPRAGVAGLRELTGVRGRALTCTAVKPLGPLAEGARRSPAHVRARGHRRDQGRPGARQPRVLPFEARVEACLDAAEQVADETGHRVLYVPNLIGTPERVFAQLRFAEKRGARAVMVSPMLLGCRPSGSCATATPRSRCSRTPRTRAPCAMRRSSCSGSSCGCTAPTR